MKKIRKIFLLFLCSCCGAVSAHNIDTKEDTMSKTGNETFLGISFTLPDKVSGTVTDIDGNNHLSSPANDHLSLFLQAESSASSSLYVKWGSVNYNYLKHII